MVGPPDRYFIPNTVNLNSYRFSRDCILPASIGRSPDSAFDLMIAINQHLPFGFASVFCRLSDRSVVELKGTTYADSKCATGICSVFSGVFAPVAIA
jgi:hypothetical protein